MRIKNTFGGSCSLTRFLLMFLAFMLPIPCSSPLGAQTLTPLYEFQGGTDGAGPNDLVRDASGNMYGTTVAEGVTAYGTVFKLDPSGNKTILYNFLGGTDGLQPHGKLVLDSSGNLYGTTEFGGDTSVTCQGYPGCGVVFKVDPVGHESVLYSFTGGVDGGEPIAGLFRDAAGNFYGTTSGGGKVGCLYVAIGCGVVFKLAPSGREMVLYSFGGANDSGYPASPVILDSSGNLYGMTTGLGANGFGTVFKIDPAGNETIVHAFLGRDGSQPYGSLIRDAKGNLYGTAYGGGDLSACSASGCGVVFKVDSTGKETVLHAFTNGADGARPAAGLVQDLQGNLYGTALVGGSCCGVVFKVTAMRHETVLYTFTGLVDGGYPEASLIRDTAGNLYGSAGGGAYGYGIIFKLTP